MAFGRRQELVDFASCVCGSLDESGKLHNKEAIVDDIERARRLEDLNTAGGLVDGLQLTATNESGREGRVGVEGRREYVDHANLMLVEQRVGLTLHGELGQRGVDSFAEAGHCVLSVWGVSVFFY